MSNVIVIVVGVGYFLVLCVDGMVWVWGDNYFFLFGDINNISLNLIILVWVLGLDNVVVIDVGVYYFG